ncbi:MAG TPA: GNAT family N-acetyltransferase, partial [Ktedonobacterales bacterium]|nr:GNAT family N-acetyltransferase [Ktedonobacterales bacterium]
RLMETMVAHARTHGLRCLVCETQTTNMPAIQFYRAQGFAIDGLDLSLYTNHDREHGEVAIFMRRQLAE